MLIKKIFFKSAISQLLKDILTAILEVKKKKNISSKFRLKSDKKNNKYKSEI